jgi:hypothetical protein
MIAVETESSLQNSGKARAEDVAEELFENTDVDNDFMADRIVWRMKSLQDKIEDYELTKEANNEFYDMKIEKLEGQIEYMQGMLKHYMEHKGLKTLATPNGTVRTSERTRHIWSDIAEIDIMRFCEENKIPLRFKPAEIDKKAVAKYIEKTGDYPKGYRQETNRSFSCKYNNTKKEL